jgi:hypothetical protein
MFTGRRDVVVWLCDVMHKKMLTVHYVNLGKILMSHGAIPIFVLVTINFEVYLCIFYVHTQIQHFK